MYKKVKNVQKVLFSSNISPLLHAGPLLASIMLSGFFLVWTPLLATMFLFDLPLLGAGFF